MAEHTTNNALRQVHSYPTVAYQAAYAHLVGSATAGLLLSQLAYYCARAEDGWVAVTYEALHHATGMSRRELDSARRALKERQLLSERRIGMPARVEYHVEFERLEEAILGLDTDSSAPSVPDDDEDGSGDAEDASLYKHDCTKRTNMIVRSVQTGVSSIESKSLSKNRAQFAHKTTTASRCVPYPEPPPDTPMHVVWAAEHRHGGILVTADLSIELRHIKQMLAQGFSESEIVDCWHDAIARRPDYALPRFLVSRIGVWKAGRRVQPRDDDGPDAMVARIMEDLHD